MKYFYALVVLFGMGSELFCADAQEHNQRNALVGLVVSERRQRFKPTWTKRLHSGRSYFVESLHDSPFVCAIAREDGSIIVLDKKNGKCLSSLLPSDPAQKVVRTQSLPGNRLVSARENGTLEVVTVNPGGDSSSSEVPVGFKDIRGMVFGKVEGVRKLVVAGIAQYGCIAEFDVDSWERQDTTINYVPECVTTSDGEIIFTEYYDSIFRRNIRTYSGKDRVEYMSDVPRQPATPLNPLYLSPYGMIGRNFAAYEFENMDHWSHEENRWTKPPRVVMRIYKRNNMMPFGIETRSRFDIERFIADGPGAIVTGLDQQLHVRNEDGAVIQTLMEGNDILDLKFENTKNHEYIFAASRSNEGHTHIAAWRAGFDDEKIDV